MLDLETLSTKPNAAIVSIGACICDNTQRFIETSFQAHVNLNTYFNTSNNAFDVSGATLQWWLNQSSEAQQATFIANASSLDDALDSFDTYLVENNAQNIPIYGNGADFDNVVLTQAYAFYFKSLPWNFRMNRCYRTMKNLVPSVEITRKAGEHHNAKADAENQAVHLLEIFEVIQNGGILK